MNHAAYALKRGDTHDPEDARFGYRLGIARAMLAGQGIEPIWAHVDTSAAYGVPHQCDYRCKCAWPGWVTDEVFELAMRLADEIQTRKGEYNRA